ncbi:MAG: MFS transporter, partial [Planctomycetota bacterium]
VPVFLRKPDGFAGSELETVIITSAVPVMAITSIFWNEVYRRMDLHFYLFLVWLLAFLPLGGIALCYQPESVVFFIVLSAFGLAGTNSISGDIMRKGYPEQVRGRLFGIMNASGQITIIILTFIIGKWLTSDDQAFRIYMPITAFILGVGNCLLYKITCEPEFLQQRKAHPAERLRTSLLNACRSMITVLRRDRNFRKYETAFFIYGTGWMICHSLLPFIVVDKLELDYDEVAYATQVTFFLVILITMVPAGYLLDKIGPIRTAALGYCCIMIYALGLMAADSVIILTIAVFFSGLGLCGVILAWTLGPVALARDPSQAAHYLAIHATLVGARALIGQYSAVFFYKYTGNLDIPLAVAVILVIFGAIVMGRLARDPSMIQKPAPAPAPIDAMSDIEHDVIP